MSPSRRAGRHGLAGARPDLSSRALRLAVRRRAPLVALLVFAALSRLRAAGRRRHRKHGSGPVPSACSACYTSGRTEGVRLAVGSAGSVGDRRRGLAGPELRRGPATSSRVILIGVAPVLVGRVLRNRAGLNRALRDRARRRGGARGRRRRGVARGAHAHRRRAARRRRPRAQRHGRAGRAPPADRAERARRARRPFAAVENTGREALTEMRRLLGVLRREDEELALAPQPSLAHVAVAGPARVGGRPARRAAGRGRARGAARRRRPDRLPGGAGGARRRAACGRAPRRADVHRALRRRRGRARGGRRRAPRGRRLLGLARARRALRRRAQGRGRPRRAAGACARGCRSGRRHEAPAARVARGLGARAGARVRQRISELGRQGPPRTGWRPTRGGGATCAAAGLASLAAAARRSCLWAVASSRSRYG